MLVIFCFSHQANSGRITEDYLGGANVPVRKFAHMFEFAVLAILYYRSLLLGAYLALQKSPDYSANNSASNSASNAATNAADYSGDSSGEKSLEIEGEFSTQISPKIANKETAKNAAASISVRESLKASGRASGRASVRASASSVNHLKLAILALFLAIAYALSDEWHQSFVPGRSATLSDVMVDASGSLIGLLLIWFGSRGRSAR